MPLHDFAPMEGITGWQFRRIHRRYFGGVDRYFSPFLSPNQHHVFSRKELWDVLPEHNEGVPLVPQILTKRAEDFLWCAGELAAMGYREVNLNCGCPSGTVVARGKGAGMLLDLRALENFLDEVFSHATVAVSVKTRLGLTDPEEFEAIWGLCCRYPLRELIVHPRLREDYYLGGVRMECFDRLLRETSPFPLGYNGDLATAEQCRQFAAERPGVASLMIGRGLLADPALVQKIKGGAGADRETLRAYHDELYETYCRAFQSKKNAIRPMKELWTYLIRLFAPDERLWRELRKAKEPAEFQTAAGRIFRELELLLDARTAS